MPKKEEKATLEKIDQILRLIGEVEKDIKEMMGALDPEWVRKHEPWSTQRTINGLRMKTEILKDYVEALHAGDLSMLEPG